MFTAKIDSKKLERDLEKYARMVNETGEDAVARWGVQLCRELARQTQAWGMNSRKRQESAIYQDALNVVMTDDTLGGNTRKGLYSASEVNDWIELNRTRRRARTAKLSYADKRICTKATFKAAMKIRLARAGIAKGGWIAAGMEVAAFQSHLDRISISPSYIGFAGRHASAKQGGIGKGTMTKTPHNPIATIHNKVPYTASNYVLGFRQIDRAIMSAGRFALKRYEAIINRKSK